MIQENNDCIILRKHIDQAIKDFDLIQKGDRILAAVSGGKDSFTMLSSLCELRKEKKSAFQLYAINIRTDFHCGACVHQKTLTDIFKQLGVEYSFKEIKVLDEKKQTSCFWCSWNRRKALFETARALKCNKIAFGHHKDDIIQTVLLNLFFKGEISTMKPRLELFNGEIAIIRPLCYVEEVLIKRVAKEKGFPEQLCKCPFGANSARRVVKNIINEIAKSHPGIDVKSSIFNSLRDIDVDSDKEF